ncbi:putative bifunctional diguanylate cyclase/phosphodiesterase [Thalassolituus oleivorans]|uniref:putative bifunctional diguanylate cyclase/phosphodiesterase n=1 Tax=Thalassolituus oleivorans TaxID=187493 RepID=UPI0023F294D6|nr:EAL domain-containing protein [Thalassolituus oleivorans]|tara:strand:+ start:10548 stop:13202 length:2655 start_codon:yes stop_codon:yes gene_type:complete
MRSAAFLPAIFADTDEFYAERGALLMKRALIGLALAIGCSLSIVFFILTSATLVHWYSIIACMFIYMFPIATAIQYGRKPPEGLDAKKAVVRKYVRQLVIVVIGWNLIAFMILPGLDPDTRLIVISMFVTVVLGHVLPLSLFPRYAIAVLVLNLIPLSLQLTSLGDADIAPLGVTGIVFAFAQMIVVAWLYCAEMKILRKVNKGIELSEPDLTTAGLRQVMISSLYLRAPPSVVLQLVVALLLVISLRTPEIESNLWCWFLAFVSMQTFRAAAFIAYVSQPNQYRIRRWRALFATSLLASQFVWFAFPFIFNAALSDFHLGVVAGVLIVIAVLSSIGLTSDRALLYANTALCISPPILFIASDINFWMLASLGLTAALTLFLVMESIHESAIRSLKGGLLHKLANYRARKMEELNLDLINARHRLTEVNASLESQVLERTQELKHQANHDMLTGLGNRYRFTNMVERALDEYHNDQSGFAIYLLDLDRFKEINDGLGHFAGDHVIRETAQRIRDVCGEDHVCARWGGDEFVILQRYVSSREEIYRFSDDLVNKLKMPIELSSGPVSIGASIGVSVCPEHGTTAEELLEHADIAVYRSKCMRGTVSIYNDNWGVEAAERVHLAQALRNAIESQGMDLALQPLIAMNTGKLTGFEALARWPQTDNAPISPGVFIPLAEECGLMPMLGRWVLQRACEMLQDVAPDSDLRVAVNISVLQLLDVDFVSEVLDVLTLTELPPERLELEMTENVFASDVEQIRNVLSQLREQGIRISIDDFGTGYSSISYLLDFPLDTLKVDRSFVTALNSGGEGIFSSIIALAHGLELSVIVEGVETQKELNSVIRLGGEEVQGFFFAKPMMLPELEGWLIEHRDTSFDIKQKFPFVSLG